ncbi:MAG: hypothetical protein LBC25_01120 [Holosporales bacterium]|nr:hypothetical protein [Holosporales bacterium]
MEDKKITSLFVVGSHGEIPEGVVHLHDLISKKIV